MNEHDERLEISRLIKADQSRIFAAWTDPEMIVQWWGAGPVKCVAAEMDLTVGGSYRIANQTPDGATVWIAGTFTVVEPPQGLAYTWAMEPIDSATEHSVVEVSFDEQREGTLVTIVHTKIANQEAKEVNLVGWAGCLDGLQRLLSG